METLKLSLADLPGLLKQQIKKSGMSATSIAPKLGLGHATISRLINAQQGMSSKTCKVLNDFFEVAYFTPYKIKDNQFIPTDIVSNGISNKFNKGDTVLNLLDHQIYEVKEVKNIKKKWMYLIHDKFIEEFFLKGVEAPSIEDTFEDKFLKTPVEITVSAEKLPIEDYTEEPTEEFVIPQFKVEPEDTIKESIEKIDNKDSIKSILTDVVTRLINLL